MKDENGKASKIGTPYMLHISNYEEIGPASTPRTTTSAPTQTVCCGDQLDPSVSARGSNVKFLPLTSSILHTGFRVLLWP